MARKSALIVVMERAAEKAARGLVRDFGEVENLQVSKKGPANFVSAADLRAEKTLREELERARPGFGFLMEESGESKGTDAEGHRWIVDPLDGTTNFLHGLPHWCISIAVEKQGDIIAGMIYDPVKNERFWAEKGQGAFLNARRMRVSGRERLQDAVIAMGTPSLAQTQKERSTFMAELDAVTAQTSGTRRMGAAALDLAYVAAGRYDGYWERGINAWDVAAGVLLVRESGGFVSSLDAGISAGDPVYSGSILAAPPQLHRELAGILSPAASAADRTAAASKA